MNLGCIFSENNSQNRPARQKHSNSPSKYPVELESGLRWTSKRYNSKELCVMIPLLARLIWYLRMHLPVCHYEYINHEVFHENTSEIQLILMQNSKCKKCKDRNNTKRKIATTHSSLQSSNALTTHVMATSFNTPLLCSKISINNATAKAGFNNQHQSINCNISSLEWANNFDPTMELSAKKGIELLIFKLYLLISVKINCLI